MNTKNLFLKETKTHWLPIAHILSVPHCQQDYQQLTELLDYLIDEVGEDEQHPLANLMELLGLLVATYETTHVPKFNIPSGVETLKYLMEEHGLSQADVPEIGSQGVVSEILNGKRQLNTRQIKALSQRFKVSPNVFF